MEIRKIILEANEEYCNSKIEEIMKKYHEFACLSNIQACVYLDWLTYKKIELYAIYELGQSKSEIEICKKDTYPCIVGIDVKIVPVDYEYIEVAPFDMDDMIYFKMRNL